MKTKKMFPCGSKVMRVMTSLKKLRCRNLLSTHNFASETGHHRSSGSPNTEAEILHHAKLAKDWWDVNGTMGALHSFNEIRVPFIRDGIVARGHVNKSYIKTLDVLKDQTILEVGCGGGLLTERLARLGADVTGIDLGEEVIEAAREHLDNESTDLLDRINYKVESIESHATKHIESYDVVVVSEVIEHIDDKAQFLTHCVAALKPGGSIFITTPNKTIPMWLGGILLSENVLKIVPKGTHHWDKLISPVDLQRILDALDCQTVLVNGSTYDFWNNTWKWVNCKAMCYALQAIKIDNNDKGKF